MNSHFQGPLAAGYLSGVGIIVATQLFSEASKTLIRVEASEDRPALMRITPIVDTVFNGGDTNVLIVGNADNDDEYLAAGDINEASATEQAGKFRRITETVDIIAEYSQTGTPATTGAIRYIIELSGEGTPPVSI